MYAVSCLLSSASECSSSGFRETGRVFDRLRQRNPDWEAWAICNNDPSGTGFLSPARLLVALCSMGGVVMTPCLEQMICESRSLSPACATYSLCMLSESSALRRERTAPCYSHAPWFDEQLGSVLAVVLRTGVIIGGAPHLLSALLTIRQAVEEART